MNIKKKTTSINFKVLFYLIVFSVSSADKLNENLEKIAYENEVCIEYITSTESISFNTRMIGCELGRDNQAILKAQTELIKSSRQTEAIRLVNQEFKAKA